MSSHPINEFISNCVECDIEDIIHTIGNLSQCKTVIIPKGENVLKHIRKLDQSDKCDYVLSCFYDNLIKDNKQFRTEQNKGGKILSKGITLVKKKCNDKYCIWESSHIIKTEDDSNNHNHNHKKKHTRKGGGEKNGGCDSAHTKRYKLTNKVLERFFLELNKHTGKILEFDPFLAKMVGLLNFLKLSHEQHYLYVMSIIDRSPFVSYFLIVEPFKTENWILPDSILFDNENGWHGAELYKDAVGEWNNHFTSILNSGSKFNVFSKNDLVHAERNKAITTILRDKNPFNYFNKLLNIYHKLNKNNSIGSINDVFPPNPSASTTGGAEDEEQVEKVVKEPDESNQKEYIRLWQDQFSFTISSEFNLLMSLLDIPDRHQKMYNFIRKIMISYPGNNYKNECSIMGSNDQIKKMASPPVELIWLVKKFINSSDFIRIISATHSPSDYVPDNPELNYSSFQKNSENIVNLRNNPDYDESFKMIQPKGIPYYILSQINFYNKQHKDIEKGQSASLASGSSALSVSQDTSSPFGN